MFSGVQGMSVLLYSEYTVLFSVCTVYVSQIHSVFEMSIVFKTSSVAIAECYIIICTCSNQSFEIPCTQRSVVTTSAITIFNLLIDDDAHYAYVHVHIRCYVTLISFLFKITKIEK